MLTQPVNASQTYLKFSELAQLSNFGSRVAEDCNDAPRLSLGENERVTVNAVVTFLADGEVGLGFLDFNWLWIPIAGESGSKPIGGV